MEPSSRPSGGPGPDPSAPDGRPLLLLCAAVFVVALGIRAWGLGDRSFWLDETETIADISEPDLAGLLARVGAIEGGKGPLFFILVRAWASLVGMEEFWLRLPSAILGSLACALTVVWVVMLQREMSSAVASVAPVARMAWFGAAAAGVVTALNPTLIAVSREARTYAFSHAFILGAVVLAVPAYLSERSRWTTLTRVATPVLAAVGCSAHVLSAYFVGGVFVATAARVRGQGRSLGPMAMGAAGFVLLMATQVSLTLGHVDAHYGGGGEAPAVGVRDLAHYGLEVLGGKPGGFVVACLLLLAAVTNLSSPSVRYGVCGAVVAMSVAVAVHFLMLPTLFGGARYLAWESFFVPVVLAGASPRQWRSLWLGLLIGGAALAVSAFNRREFERVHAEDWRAVATLLKAEVRDSDVLLCHRGYVSRPLRHYFPDHDAVVPCTPRLASDGGCSCLESAQGRAKSGRRVFLVWSHAEPWESRRAEFEAALGPAEVIHEQYAIRVLRFGR